MKRFLSGLLATALAASVTATGMLPAAAAPFAVVPQVDRAAELPIVNVQSRERWRNRDRREARREFRRDGREFRRDRREARRDFRRDGRHGYYRGYRGYRDYRPGYRRYGDFWFPAAAFIAGAAITGAIANSQPRVEYRVGGSHTEWCYNRYRSYRAYDNTFQPYNGPRRQCVSPYG